MSKRLGESGHAAQQAVSAGEEHEQHLVNDLILTDEDAPQLGLQPTHEIGAGIEVERGRRGG